MDFINEQDRADTFVQAVTGRLEYPPDLGCVRIGRAELNEFGSVSRASSQAIVVFSVPGSSQRMNDGRGPEPKPTPSGPSALSRWFCPTTSLGESGLIRSASGHRGSDASARSSTDRRLSSPAVFRLIPSAGRRVRKPLPGQRCGKHIPHLVG